MDKIRTEVQQNKTEFVDDDIKITLSSPSLAYQRRTNDQKTAVAWGQRKLFLTEVQFLTLHCNHSDPNVVYAGAAPGHHIPLLATMFPNIKWYLYDPRDFGISETESIKIYQQYFTDKDAEVWAGKDNVFFISDIRTADYRSQDRLENEQSVISDHRMQEQWHRIIKPVKSHLKFRLPYFLDYPVEKNFRYLSGVVYKQPWAPPSSTETRLVPGDDDIEWDIQKYEEQLFYHNSVIRECQQYNILPLEELSNDFDSCLERRIFLDYLEKVGGIEAATDENLQSLVKLLTVTLNEGRKQTEWVTLAKLRKDPLLIKRRFMNK